MMEIWGSIMIGVPWTCLQSVLKHSSRTEAAFQTETNLYNMKTLNV